AYPHGDRVRRGGRLACVRGEVGRTATRRTSACTGRWRDDPPLTPSGPAYVSAARVRREDPAPRDPRRFALGTSSTSRRAFGRRRSLERRDAAVAPHGRSATTGTLQRSFDGGAAPREAAARQGPAERLASFPIVNRPSNGRKAQRRIRRANGS